MFISIDTPRIYQVNSTVVELQCVSTQGFSFLQHVLAALLNVVGGFLDLVPIAAVSTAEARRVLEVATNHQKPATQLSLPELVVAARQPSVIKAATAFNLSDLIGFNFVITLAESPIDGVVSNLVNGGLAVINGTWSLSRLITEAQLSVDDVRFFQWGYITDWVRDAGTSLGLVGKVWIRAHRPPPLQLSCRRPLTTRCISCWPTLATLSPMPCRLLVRLPLLCFGVFLFLHVPTRRPVAVKFSRHTGDIRTRDGAVGLESGRLLALRTHSNVQCPEACVWVGEEM